MNPHMHPVRETEVIALRAELAKVTRERDAYLAALESIRAQHANDNHGVIQ